MTIIEFYGSLIANPAKIFFFGYNIELEPTNGSNEHILCAADWPRSIKIHFDSKKGLWEPSWQNWGNTLYPVKTDAIIIILLIVIKLIKSIYFAIRLRSTSPFEGE